MTTASVTLPDALGDAAREFIAGPHGLLIGAERPDAADGRTFATLDPSTGREIAEVALPGPRMSRGQSRPRARRSPTVRGRQCPPPAASA